MQDKRFARSIVGFFIRVAFLSAVLVLPASGQVRILGLDEQSHMVYFVDREDNAPLYRLQLSTDELWEGVIPPWLKVGIYYGRAREDSRGKKIAISPPGDMPHGAEVDLDLAEVGSCGKGQHWVWNSGQATCSAGDNWESQESLTPKWFGRIERNWGAVDRLAVFSFFYPRFTQGLCRVEEPPGKIIFTPFPGGCADEFYDSIVQLAAHVMRVMPAPDLPEKARMHLIKGGTLIGTLNENPNSKPMTAASLMRSENSMNRFASLPGNAAAHFDLAEAFELQRLYSAAIVELHRYLLLAPDEDTREARDHLYRDEAKVEAEKNRAEQ